ncbi:hypothetical protein FGG08_001620 [Glutinoglossum americanum]|uniref:Uncharacterized protein n=1 Tax=Glutinoglossum americanum TaxID=1670608 RepID=A0A9P8L558_9PEZI|nr:hypothetical protein FGG08_001620 [Glutinoglossum americanum]
MAQSSAKNFGTGSDSVSGRLPPCEWKQNPCGIDAQEVRCIADDDSEATHLEGEEPATPDRSGVQAVFRGNRAFGEGKKKASGLPQLDAGRKRARARESSDSSLLEISSENYGLPSCGTKKAGFSPRGKLGRCVGGDELSCLDQGMSRSGEPQRAFERRPRHRTRTDLYDSKPPRLKRKMASGSKTKQTLTRRIREKPGDALHKSFASETISKERLTLNPSSRVGLFKRGRASSPVRKRGLPDLAFSEMQFLHDQKNSANNKPQEGLDEKRRCGKDRDIELHEKFSSYFTAAQPAFGEEGLTCCSPSPQDARKHPLASEGQCDQEAYKATGEASITHLASERARQSPLRIVSGPKCVSAPHKQRPEPATWLGGDAMSEVTDKFSWSVSAGSAVPLDVSTNGNQSRTIGSICHPFPKASADVERVNHGGLPGLAADSQVLTHERRSHDDGLVPHQQNHSTCVKHHHGTGYQEARMNFKNALSGEALTKEVEQLTPDIENQLEPKSPAWLGSRIDRGASNEQYTPGPDSHSTMSKSKDQPSPPLATLLRDYEITPRILSRKSGEEASSVASASCSVHLGRTKTPLEGIVASAGALPIGAGPDIQQVGLVARSKYESSDTALNKILSLDLTPTRAGGHQLDRCDYYGSRGVTEPRRDREDITKRLRPPSPYVSRTDATVWTLPSNGWESREEEDLSAFYVSSTELYGLQTRPTANKSIAQTDTQRGLVLATNFEGLKKILQPRPCVALGPADVDTIELGHYRQCCYQGTSLRNFYNHSLYDSPDSDMIKIPSGEESPDGKRADLDCLEACGSIPGNLRPLQPGYPRIEDPFVKDTFRGVHETSWNRGQRLHNNYTTQEERKLQIRSHNMDGMPTAAFWRPHRLY